MARYSEIDIFIWQRIGGGNIARRWMGWLGAANKEKIFSYTHHILWYARYNVCVCECVYMCIWISACVCVCLCVWIILWLVREDEVVNKMIRLEFLWLNFDLWPAKGK